MSRPSVQQGCKQIKKYHDGIFEGNSPLGSRTPAPKCKPVELVQFDRLTKFKLD